MASNAWCVSIRWKPTVTPSPISTYSTTSRRRSVQPTARFHSSAMATTNATNGTTVIVSMMVFWPQPAASS